MRNPALVRTTSGPTVEQRIASLDRPAIEADLDAFGCASTGKLLAPDECAAIAARIRSGRQLTLGINFRDAK